MVFCRLEIKSKPTIVAEINRKSTRGSVKTLKFVSKVAVQSGNICGPYRGLMRPCMEYGSYVWGGSTHTALLNKGESKFFRFIYSAPLTDCLDSLSHRRNVAFLSLLYRYFHADCFSELANCIPPPLPRPHCTTLSTSSYPCSVLHSSVRFNQYLQSFIPYIGKLWNSPSLSVFPLAYDLSSL